MDDLGGLGDLGHREREIVRFRAEYRLHLDVANQFLCRGDGGCDIRAVVALDHLQLVVLAADGDTASVVDLLDGEADASWQRVAGGNEGAGFGGDDADLDGFGFLARGRIGERAEAQCQGGAP